MCAPAYVNVGYHNNNYSGNKFVVRNSGISLADGSALTAYTARF